MRSSWALASLALGLAGLAGIWPQLPSWLLLAGVAWLPGYVLLLAVEPRAGAGGSVDDCYASLRGPGALALGCAASLALIVPVFAPFFLLQASLASAKSAYSIVFVVIAGLVLRRRSQPARPGGAGRSWEWGAGAVAVVSLLPVVLAHAGATIDDWWDLSFIRAYVERPALSFEEPVLGTGGAHPRFLWNSWYVVQALVLDGRLGEAVAFQAGPLAAFVCATVVSAQALLARAFLCGVGRLVPTLAILVVPLWLYGTEALPFFTRLHQDKFVAGLILVPVLLSASLYCLRESSRSAAAITFVAAVAACATHSLVFGVGMIGVAAIALAELSFGRERARSVALVAAVTLPVLLYPLGQALILRGRFHAQGIALANVDNPVVLAHLSLERILWPHSTWYVVNPTAVFGLIACVAVIGAWRCIRRRDEPVLRALSSLSAVPSALIFIPGVAALAGVFIVPWMVYRIGWLVPVPLLVALAIICAWRRERWRVVATAALVVVSLLASLPTAADRLRRDMREHPGARERGPRGSTLALYEFLSTLPPDSLVVAETSLSRLIPSMTGNPTLAMAERATLVFSPDELSAYRRLRDRASFYSWRADASLREAIVERHGLTHAVFRRRWITDGSQARWVRGSVGAGFPAYLEGSAARTHSSERGGLLDALPGGTEIILADRDFFVVAFPTQSPGSPAVQASAAPAWWSEFDLSTDWVGADASEVVASAVRYPGALAEFHPPPLALGATSFPVWTSGSEVWDDAPTEVRVVLTMRAACPVEAVELIPYLPAGRREVFEIEVGDRMVRRRARHKRPLFVELDGSMEERVEVRVRSMLGATFGIGDLKIRARREHCVSQWEAVGEPRWPQSEAGVDAAMDLAKAFPERAAASLLLASTLGDAGFESDARAVIRLAVGQASDEAVVWIEKGLLEDSTGDFSEALASFRTAVRTDSNSAWARGCLAWAELRRKRPVAAIWHAARAAMLDHDYADAYTILASSAKRLGLRTVARRLLKRSIAMDTYRSWGYLELARMMNEEGDRDSALALLESYLALVPFDSDALSALEYYRRSAEGA